MDDNILEIKLDNSINKKNFQNICDNVILRMGSDIDEIVVDCSGVRYISEYNLDLLLEIKKKCFEVTLINVHMGAYEVLRRYRFDNFLNVHREFEEISIKGLKEIGHGNMGKIYEIDDERILKTYNDIDALETIESERRNAREAFVSGIDSMMVFEVVKLKDANGYGLILEKAGKMNIKEYLQVYPKKKNEYSKKLGEFVRRINGVYADKDIFKRLSDKYKDIIKRETKFLGDKYSKQLLEIYDIIDNAPHNDRLLHGDIHFKNMMLDDNENMILIDFGEAGYGNNMLEIGRVYTLMYSSGVILKDLFGVAKKERDRLFNLFLEGYFQKISDREKIKLYEFLEAYKKIFFPIVFANQIRNKGKIVKIIAKCVFLLHLKTDVKKCMKIIKRFDYEKYSVKGKI